MEERERMIGDRLYIRKPVFDRTTGQPYWKYTEYSRVATQGMPRKNFGAGTDENGVDHKDWELQRKWDHGPGEQFYGLIGSLKLVSALPRSRTPVELEIESLRKEGKTATADMLEKAHPAAPPEMIAEKGRLVKIDPDADKTVTMLFDVNAETVLIGKQTITLLAPSNAELRSWLTRHARGDGGTFGSCRTEDITWTEDRAWHPELAGENYVSEFAARVSSGLAKSRFGAFRPSVDSPGETYAGPYRPGVDGTPEEHAYNRDRYHAGLERRRNSNDEVTVVSLLIPDKPTRTVIYSNRDQVLTRFGGA